MLLAAAGLVARVVLAGISEGSNDVEIWRDWATLLGDQTLTQMYSNAEEFNHPPLMAYWALAALRLESAGFLRFSIWLKLPSLIAEGITSYLLWRIWRPAGQLISAAAVALFAWNLDSILVSGFHANTDALCAMLCLASALGIDRGNFFRGGLALAAALNVKLLPLVLVPALLLQARTRRQIVDFLAALGLGTLPFLPFVISAWAGFYRHVMSYNSTLEKWGIVLLFKVAKRIPGFEEIGAHLVDLYHQAGRLLIMASCVILGAYGRRRGWSAYRVAFLCLATVLILAPGFGVQYTVYVVPVLFAISLPQAATYSLVSGFFILSVYLSFALPGFPLRSHFTGRFSHFSSALGLVTWIVLTTIVVWHLISDARRQQVLRVIAGPLGDKIRSDQPTQVP